MSSPFSHSHNLREIKCEFPDMLGIIVMNVDGATESTVVPLKQVDEYRYLEIITDSNLQWMVRCTSLLNKLRIVSYLLHHLAGSVSRVRRENKYVERWYRSICIKCHSVSFSHLQTLLVVA